jgi:acyl carrier protein
MDSTTAIRQHIVAEYLADASVSQLPDDYDLLGNGVIDSLGLLRLIAWLEQRFGVSVDEIDIAPEDFRTVSAIGDVVARARSVSGPGGFASTTTDHQER